MDKRKHPSVALAARTDAELAEERKQMLPLLKEFIDVPDDLVFTCDDCPHRYTCELVFDGYNVDGDCLAEK